MVPNQLQYGPSLGCNLCPSAQQPQLNSPSHRSFLTCRTDFLQSEWFGEAFSPYWPSLSPRCPFQPINVRLQRNCLICKRSQVYDRFAAVLPIVDAWRWVFFDDVFRLCLTDAQQRHGGLRVPDYWWQGSVGRWLQIRCCRTKLIGNILDWLVTFFFVE